MRPTTPTQPEKVLLGNKEVVFIVDVNTMAQVHGGIDEKVEVTWDLPRCVIKTSLLMSLRPLIAMMKGLLGFREKGAKLKWNLWKLLRYGEGFDGMRRGFLILGC